MIHVISFYFLAIEDAAEYLNTIWEFKNTSDNYCDR